MTQSEKGAGRRTHAMAGRWDCLGLEVDGSNVPKWCGGGQDGAA